MLIDVRNAGEYKEGHIPGSKNVPLKEVDAILEVVPDKKTPLFVHCLSGVRSSQAVARMVELGYTNVKNIGGIGAYKGITE